MITRRFRVYCQTEAEYYYVYSQTEPTECPVNAMDTLDSSATCVDEEVPANQQDIWIFADLKTTGVQAGSFSAGSWQTRDLNTTLYSSDSDSISLGSNTFTITQPGNYLVTATAPGHKVNNHQLRLYDVTNASVVGYGPVSSSKENESRAALQLTIHPTDTTEYRLEHYGRSNRNHDGLGQAIGISGESERYTHVMIQRFYTSM